ncbi:hypothetical protein C7C46_17395 [Streptomyces tateyamensis]|uniref:RNA polymerase sigma factor 70 region 4 type 2 domain-containing protein n=1 Tax=Streptomyces tateyamensis TaxID=565073 RepID=A0A2V4N975_9ACTN|nr:sigma factor-like helix-turn-helix DNA-binding protein [Streptomyces tateyamensis]PYC78103.1 hypothetical protein C7C46_17395 [Streptomyces tateyamensis]
MRQEGSPAPAPDPTAAPAPAHAADQAAEPGPAAPTLADFEALYAVLGAELVQQAYLLTGRRRSARAAVHRAFAAAWPRWSQLGTAADPAAWLRRRSHEAALAPWHPVGPRRTHRLPPARRRITVPALPDAAGRDRALLTAVRRLSRPRRRVLVLHDALGLAPAAIAAEVEASTGAVTARLAAAHAQLARSVPALVGSDPTAPGFGERLGGLLYRAAERGCPAAPEPGGTAALRARGRLRLLAPPVAASALVLATLGAFGATLAGHPLVHGPATPRRQVCVAAANAGPAAAGADTALRSDWCTKHDAPDR